MASSLYQTKEIISREKFEKYFFPKLLKKTGRLHLNTFFVLNAILWVARMSITETHRNAPKFDDVNEFKLKLENYIYYYNNDRIKEKLNGQSPVKYRIMLNQ